VFILRYEVTFTSKIIIIIIGIIINIETTEAKKKKLAKFELWKKSN
jgi:hypothetical protein